jgi:hypothetical protein
MQFQAIAKFAAMGLLLALPVSAFAQGVSPATPQVGTQTAPLDGHYQGMFVCEKLPTVPTFLRAPLDIIVAGTDVRFARPMFNPEANRVVGTEMASGTLAADGKVVLASKGTAASNAAFVGNYAGTLSLSGGTLTGTQVFTTPNGSRTRTCHGAFVKTGS